ncbi:MAG: hypothetical protein OHK0039_02030 [Bacteroidia bacterium]
MHRIGAWLILLCSIWVFVFITFLQPAYALKRSQALPDIEIPANGRLAAYYRDSELQVSYDASPDQARYRPVYLSLYDDAGRLMYITKNPDFSSFNTPVIKLSQSSPGRYQLKVELDNGLHLTEWVHVE